MEKSKLLIEKFRVVEFNKQFGLKTVFFVGKESSVAGYSEGDTIFLNENFADFAKVNEHEILHFFETSSKFCEVKRNILSSFSQEDLKKLYDKYELKYFGLYPENEMSSRIETEIAIDVLCENGISNAKFLSENKEVVSEICEQPVQFLGEKRFLNIGLSKKLDEQFKNLTKWEKIFVLNYYNSGNPLPHEKKTKYQVVRNDIEEALEKLYKFVDDKQNFKIESKNNEYLERQFNGQLEGLKAHGEEETAQKFLQDKNFHLEKMAEEFSEILYKEIKNIKDFLSSTDYEPAFKFLMLNETLTKIYRKEKQNEKEETLVQKRELNKSIAGHMTLNKTVLETIYSNPDVYPNFASLYFSSLVLLNEKLVDKSTVNFENLETFGKGKWIKFDSKDKSPENFIQNSKNLSSLVQNTPWCTKQIAGEHLSGGDFYVFVDNKNKPHIAVKMNGNEIGEVRGIKGDSLQELEDDYRDVVLSFLSNNKDIVHGKEWLEKEEWNKRVFEDLKLLDDTEKMSKKQAEKILSDILENRGNKAIELVISLKKHIKGFCKALDCSTKDFYLGNYVAEGKKPIECKYILGDAYFKNYNGEKVKNVVYVSGDADFSYSNVESLGSIASVGGDLSLSYSKVKDLGNLDSIGGRVSFQNTRIENLGKLTKIFGDASFCYSNVTDLGGLAYIGNSADFARSKIKSLKNVIFVGGNANFVFSQAEDVGALEHIGGYAYFSHSQIKDLKNLSYIGGFADFSNSKIINLGRLTSLCDCDFSGSKIKDLGNIKIIYGNANFKESNITDLKNLTSIGEFADFSACKAKSLGNLTSVGGDVYFANSQIEDLGNLTSIGGKVDFTGVKLKNIGKLQLVKGDILGLKKCLLLKFEKTPQGYVLKFKDNLKPQKVDSKEEYQIV